MIRSIFSILFLFLFPVNYSSGNEYRGTIIDAHSQWGCEFPPKVIFNAIKKRKTDHTLLSVRCAPKKGDPVEVHLKLVKLVESLGKQVIRTIENMVSEKEEIIGQVSMIPVKIVIRKSTKA